MNPISVCLFIVTSHHSLSTTCVVVCFQDEPSENVDKLSHAMQMFAPEHWLCGEELFLAPSAVLRRWALPCLALLTARRMNVLILSKHFHSRAGPESASSFSEQLPQHAGGSTEEGVKHKRVKRKEMEKKSSESADATDVELTEPWFGTRYSVRGAPMFMFSI